MTDAEWDEFKATLSSNAVNEEYWADMSNYAAGKTDIDDYEDKYEEDLYDVEGSYYGNEEDSYE